MNPVEHIEHAENVTVTWVGHSTFLIRVGDSHDNSHSASSAGSFNILTDPIWSQRASPVQFIGPKRYTQPAIPFADLPPINLVLISHTHYDHLDRLTVKALVKKARDAGTPPPHFIVPPGVKKWFAKLGITTVSELAWWERSENLASIPTRALTPSATQPLTQPIHVTAVPAKHWSKRNLFGTSGAGWGGYVIDTPRGRIYFVGDSAYRPDYFRDIGERLGPIALSLIPIGAYSPRSFMKNSHVNPAEAVLIHQAVRSEKSIGMHWGTFNLSQEPKDEPPQLLTQEAHAAGLDPEAFITVHPGQTFAL